MVSGWRGSLTQNRRKYAIFFTILVAYLGHGIFNPVAVLFFSKSVFGRCLLCSQIEEPQKKQWLVHLYRSTRFRVYSGIPNEKGMMSESCCCCCCSRRACGLASGYSRQVLVQQQQLFRYDSSPFFLLNS